MVLDEVGMVSVGLYEVGVVSGCNGCVGVATTFRMTSQSCGHPIMYPNTSNTNTQHNTLQNNLTPGLRLSKQFHVP